VAQHLAQRALGGGDVVVAQGGGKALGLVALGGAGLLLADLGLWRPWAIVALALVLGGELDVAATMVDAAAARIGRGSPLRSRGTTEEGVPLRLIAASESAIVATWNDEQVALAFKACPWVEDDLRAASDRVQTLVGVTIGPFGERLDTSLRDQIASKLEIRSLAPGEVIVAQGKPVPGLVIVGVGGNWLIRRNLAPLVRVADTARQVSDLKLDSGAVRLPARVAAADADPHTEVGQVGHALNTMLDNVEDALKTRQASETRVRQFVADASHELRTPLASIRGYAELSRREPDPVPASVTHALSRVESEALRMQGLVEDLLLLARLDSGRPLEQAPVDLTLLAMDVVSDAYAAAPDHVWELDLPDEPVEVPGDQARLHQVLANLLANARTHTPAGTRVVTRVRPEADVVRVTVEDDGPGIPESLQPNVFERFTRGDDSRNRASGSTGLGLSIVAAVAGAHQGRVELDSQPGRTAFSVLLPTSPEVRAAVPTPPTKE